MIQEHWLYSFEQEEILNDLPGWNFSCRSVDEYDNISLISRPQGYGGVATLWKAGLNAYMKKSKEGNERILPTFLETEKSKTLLINCYLPSGNSKNALEKFESDLSILEVLIDKYQQDYQIILGGDLNADVINRNSRKETMLELLFKNLGLNMANQDIPDEYTFHHKSFKDCKSHLDYFYVSPCIKYSIKLYTWTATNTSAHTPVELRIAENHPNVSSMENPNNSTSVKRIKWSEGDIRGYQKTLSEALRSLDTEALPMEDAIQQLQQCVIQAESEHIPSKTSKTFKGPSRKLSPKLAEAVATSKKSHYLWKSAGRPGDHHPLSEQRKKHTKEVRKVQRQEAIDSRNKLYQDIMVAHEKDQATFYRLLKHQHGARGQVTALKLQGELVYDQDIQREAWADYFQSLATPGTPPEEDLLEAMRWYNRANSQQLLVQEDTLIRVMKKLNPGKAADIYGLQAEHFKLAGEALIPALRGIIQRILDTGSIPLSMKTGFKLPIPKKKKDSTQQGNYRGITITPILCKILEHTILELWKSPLDGNINGLQFGFEQGKSPTMASICLTETIAMAKDSKIPLYVTSLDAQKAFDVVDHSILRSRVFHSGMTGLGWTLIDDLHVNCNENVRWKGSLSKPYSVSQGVRQGGVLSTILYKKYLDPLLQEMELAGTGTFIGDIYLGIPTCADDVLLLSNEKTQMQAMLRRTYEYSQQNKYTLHPQKSTTSQLCRKTKLSSRPDVLYLGEEEITKAEEFTHLGLQWNEARSRPIITERIQTAYKTAYMLIGRGIHGSNGINPAVSSKVMTSQVLPRLTHGLEAVVLPKYELHKIDNVYRSLLRQQQGLPERTALEAIHLLNGTLPATANIHYKMLLTFGSITRLDSNNPLKRLAIRQLTLEDSSHSWFVELRNIATDYDINLVKVWKQEWNKLSWKKYVKVSILTRWHGILLEGASNKSSLNLLE